MIIYNGKVKNIKLFFGVMKKRFGNITIGELNRILAVEKINKAIGGQK